MPAQHCRQEQAVRLEGSAALGYHSLRPAAVPAEGREGAGCETLKGVDGFPVALARMHPVMHILGTPQGSAAALLAQCAISVEVQRVHTGPVRAHKCRVCLAVSSPARMAPHGRTVRNSHHGAPEHPAAGLLCFHIYNGAATASAPH